jgi:hypothetical protein
VPFLLLSTQVKMPYEIRQSAKGYCVHKQGDSGPALGCHKSKSKALRQMKALYANESETMKAEGKGYGARAGETIRGNLIRGGDGKFGSAGDSATATPAAERKPTIRNQRLGRTAAANEERKRQARDAKRRATATESERKRQARGAATEQRKRERAARREAEKNRRAEEKKRKLAANRKAALDATGISEESMRALEDFAKGGELEFDSELADVLVSLGLVTPTGPGREIYKLGAAGKSFLAAAKSGDIRQAKDAIADGRETVRKRREARKRELEREKEASLSVFKDATGRFRWVLLSSNGYRDRDGEIVSTKALTQDVARADADKDYGPLRWWHVPGMDIGDCDYNAMSGRVLVESGTFRSEAIGRAVFKAQGDLQASIGFRHPTTEPDHEKVYHHIRRFERSLTPVGRASNPLTRLIVKQGGTMEDEKMQAFKALFGQAGEDALKEVMGRIQATEKAADAAGVAYKEAPEAPALTLERAETVGSNAGEATFTLTPRDVANIITVLNDAETIKAEGEPEMEEDGEEMEMEVEERIYAGDLDPDELVSKIAAAVAEAITPLVQAMDMTTKMGAMVNELKGLMGATRKDDDIALIQEQQARKALEDAKAIATLKQEQEAMASRFKEVSDKLAELTGEQPRALQQGGYRASQASDTVPQTTALKASSPVGLDPNFFSEFLGGQSNLLPPE